MVRKKVKIRNMMQVTTSRNQSQIYFFALLLSLHLIIVWNGVSECLKFSDLFLKWSKKDWFWRKI